MPFARPTLATIVERVRSDIESRLPGADAHLKNTVESILSIALAGAANQLHGHISWLSKQILPDTAEGQFLDRHASIRGLTRTTATKSTGNLPVTGVAGSVIPVSTKYSTTDGQTFSTLAEITLDESGEGIVSLEADVAGIYGNLISGTTLTLVSPIAGVDPSGVITAAFEEGTNIESDANLRARVLLAWQAQERGGTAADYISWALEVAGNTRAWAWGAKDNVGLLPGCVLVTFVRDSDIDLIPNQSEVDATQAHLETVKPITADVIVAAPLSEPIDITISNLSPNTQAVKDSIAAELADLFFNEAAPGEIMLRSHIDQAISSANGEVDHLLVSPATDSTPSGALYLPTLGTITYV